MLLTLFTLSGPVIGGAVYYLHSDALFWIRTVLAGVNLFLNLATGVMKFPILPLVFVVAAIALLTPWFDGAAVGLLAWTALEAIGEIRSLNRFTRHSGGGSHDEK